MSQGHHQGFWTKYIFSTDHKMVARQFLFLALGMAVFGGFYAFLIRWQMAFPNQPAPFYGAVTPYKYNVIITMHGTIMLFFVGMPFPGRRSVLADCNHRGSRRRIIPKGKAARIRDGPDVRCGAVVVFEVSRVDDH